MNLKREIKKIIRETLTETIKGESEGQETTEPTEKPKRKRKQPYKSNNPLSRKNLRGLTPLQILALKIDNQEKLIAGHINTLNHLHEKDQPDWVRITKELLKKDQQKLKDMQNEYLELEGLSPMEEKTPEEIVDAPLTTRRLGLG
jgi:hypothetical protein